MFLNSLLLNLNHPMKYLPRSMKTQLAADGTEIEGEGYEDGRSTWQTVVDPFSLASGNKGTNK